jgi:hypothetical protein
VIPNLERNFLLRREFACGKLTAVSDDITPDELRAELKKYAETMGLQNAASQIGISREALARAVAGLPVRTGTISRIREKLRQRKGV